MTGANDTIGIISGMVGCLASIVSIIPVLKGPLKRCISQIEQWQASLETLEKNNEEFKNAIEVAKNQRFENQDDKDRWLGKVDTYFKEYETKKPEIQMQNPRILFGCLPDYYGMYRNVRRIDDLSQRLGFLKKELERQVKSSSERDRKELERKCRDSAALQRVQDANNLWSLTCGSKTKIIGVCGAGGTGKTEVVSRVFNTLLEQYWAFDNFFWVTASHDDDLQMLQRKISNEIGLNLPSPDDVDANAEMILQTLLMKGMFLLVLDNIWNVFPSEQIGIPTHAGQYTVIITSRCRSVCREMASEMIDLKFLSNKEAYKLLRAELNDVSLPEQVEPILKNVTEEFGGLPLAIVTAANHLRKLDLKVEPAAAWEGKLKSLVVEEVSENLKTSYEHLKLSSEHRGIQECFKYCTLQPRKYDFGAKELMEHWMWGGLLGDVRRIEECLAGAEEILNELKDACLLESTQQERDVEKVKMHPLIWETAVQITKASGAKFLTKFGGGVRENFSEDWPEDVEVVSLKRTDMKELRLGVRFDKLTTLLLQDNSEIHLHNDLFNSLPNLTLLDLSNTKVSSLPVSIGDLKNLYALFLRNCQDLATLPASLSKLVALKALDISGNRHVKELPSGMHDLNKLIRLNVSRTGLTSFPTGLANFYHLQELMMIGCELKWQSKSSPMQALPVSAACVQDLRELKALSVLEITFGSTSIFRDYIALKRWLRLTSFKFCVGDVYNGKMGNNSLAFLREFPNDPDDWLPSTTLELLVMHCNEETLLTRRPSFENLRVVYVSFCAKLKYLFKRESMSILKHLEEIVVQKCENLEKVIEKDDQVSSISNTRLTMPKLQKMTLLNLPALRSVSDYEMKCDSIQSIGVWKCEKLVTFPVLVTHSKKGSLAGQIEVKGDKNWLASLEKFPADAKALCQYNVTEAKSINDLISRERNAAHADAGRVPIGSID